MADLPKSARCVVIGAGIVGNSLVYHLARLGWRDIVLVDKGPLPNPGGSTGHASNFIFPVDHSKEMSLLTLDSIAQFQEAGVYVDSGGIEVARTPERMQELTRRITSAKSWGIDAELLTPAQVKEKVPYLNADIILGGFYTPTAGVVDPLYFGTLMRERAQELGALTTAPNVEVTGLDVVHGRIAAVQTNQGVIKADTVVIACGVWAPRIARMAGATIPLVPMVHQLVSVGPIPLFESTTGEVDFPVIRDMDANMYERQNGSDMEVGSYIHRPMHHDPDDIPSIEEAALSPTELPFTQDDFDEALELALELLGDALAAEGAGIRHSINGLMSLTPDGGPMIGETEVGGLWSCAAIWIKEAPGFARMCAEWMIHNTTEFDITASNVARFYGHARTKKHIWSRTGESFNKMYGIVHPFEQYESSRFARVSPFFARTEALGAFYYDAGGFERPHWYETNRPLLDEYRDRLMDRPAEWDSRWWSPIINAEHLAMRDRVGLVDLSSFSIFDFSGPGALDFIQYMTVNQMDVKVGRAVYTPLLTPNGGFKADLTVMRLAEDRFRVVTGGAGGNVDKQWFRQHLPDGSVRFDEQTFAICTAGLWGPRARDVLQAVCEDDVSNEGFPFGAVKEITVGNVRALALRISYVGELGWELYCHNENGIALWDTLWEAGRAHGMAAVGMGVYGTTARLEKSYRAFGMELEGDYNPVEAGLARPKVKPADFIGREAYLQARASEPAALLCTLTVENNLSSDGVPRYMLGGEPILSLDGNAIEDRHKRRAYVTSAGSGPSIGKHLLLSYLPPEYAQIGVELRVEYFGEQYPVRVAVVGNTPLFDPEDSRMKR